MALPCEIDTEIQQQTLFDDFTVEKESSLSLSAGPSEIFESANEMDQSQMNIAKTPGRERYRQPQNWKVQEAKRKRNSGQEYVSYSTKKTVKPRIIKESCEKKNCRTKFYTKISEDQRIIFQKFWALGNQNRHMDFLAKHVTREQKKVETIRNTNSRRQFTMK
ncbi:uncharacterized protein LOC114325634 isoform X1 [Diabrotica virgifera virgifera]|uniref:Uncharacterized protein n=1 Tax=Diabrotica virgifera virgifera TaxID=50390 RepID=A0ABM5KN95_DIAVI|nr:uncharacterized protein LOC114325634 isoform X1 [Diabrotica virgifera virgifera]